MSEDYDPSPRTAAALAAYEQAQKALAAARDELRDAVAEDLRTCGLSSDVVAKKLPWTGETVRTLAHEYGIPLKRKPTVGPLKSQRRKTGGRSSG